MKSSSGRPIHPTERGRLFQLGNVQEERSAIQRKFYNQLKAVNGMLECEPEHLDMVEEADKLEKLYQEFTVLYGKCQVLISEDCREEEDKIAEKVDEDMHRHKQMYRAWLMQRYPSSQSKSHRSSRKSVRSKSSRSSKCLSEMLALEKAKLAELKIEIEHRETIEAHKQQLRNAESEFEIAKAAAKVKVFEQELNEGQEDDSLRLYKLPKFRSGEYAENFVEHLNGRESSVIPNSVIETLPMQSLPTSLAQSHQTLDPVDNIASLLFDNVSPLSSRHAPTSDVSHAVSSSALYSPLPIYSQTVPSSCQTTQPCSDITPPAVS